MGEETKKMLVGEVVLYILGLYSVRSCMKSLKVEGCKRDRYCVRGSETEAEASRQIGRQADRQQTVKKDRLSNKTKSRRERNTNAGTPATWCLTGLHHCQTWTEKDEDIGF